MNEYILIVDDDSDISNLLGIYLANEGYQFLKCDNAITALELLDQVKVSLILLDVMMPKMDGISACIKIREKTKVPIIFLSAKSDDMDIIEGLMVGGDDYVTKPFNAAQLMSRIKAQLRRYRQYNNQASYTTMMNYEDLSLNIETHQVWVNGYEINLTFKEFAILEYLLRNKGIVLSMKQIYENVWHEEFISAENTVMMHIANIRKKINFDYHERDYIKTVWGKGYKI